MLAFMPEIETRRIAAPPPGPRAAAGGTGRRRRGGRGRTCPADRSASARRPGRARAPAPISARPGWRTCLHLDPASGAVLGEVRWGGQLVHLATTCTAPCCSAGRRALGRLPRPAAAGAAAGRAGPRRLAARRCRGGSGSSPGRAARPPAAGQPARGARPAGGAAAAGRGRHRAGAVLPADPQWALYRVTRATPQPPPMPGHGPVDLAGALDLAEAARPGWQLLCSTRRAGRRRAAHHGLAPPARLARAQDQVVTVERRPARRPVALPHPAGGSAPGSPRCMPAPSSACRTGSSWCCSGCCRWRSGYFGLALWWRARVGSGGPRRVTA